MPDFHTPDERVADCELTSPVIVYAPGVTFERVRFKVADPQHTLLTTGERTHVIDCDFLGDYLTGCRRAIAVNSPGVVVRQSRFHDIHHAQDAACIAGWDGTKDLLVEDCFGEASGENVIFGGADCQGEDRIPQDITIRRCTWTKPERWKAKPNDATCKNLFELKNARRVLFEDCNLANSWTDGQTGFGIVLTVRNQDGGNPYAVVEDVLIRKCVMRNVESAVQILGTDDTHPSGLMRRVTFEHCQFEYLHGNGVQLGNGVEGLTFADVKLWSPNNGKFLAFNNPQRPVVGLVMTNIDANEGQYGILGDDSSPGIPTLDMYAPGASFQNVLLWRGPNGPYPYPPGISVQ